ncbi:MAG: lantibiotic immunity ABC transporter MutG family permease subunit [Cellulosilyticaceae bacterium]
MKGFVRNYKAELYQMLHSKLLLVHLVVPLIGILLFTSYYSYVPWNDVDQVATYLQVVAMAFPILIAIVIGMDYEEEKHAAYFQRLLTVPYSRKLGHLSKLLALGTLGVIAVVITVVGFGIPAIAMGNHVIELITYFKLALLLFVTYIGWYIIEYIVSFRWGSGSALGLGITGSLLSAILAFDLGNGIWQVTPCAWGTRLVGYAFGMTQTHADQAVRVLFEQGVGYMLIISLLLFILFAFWSERWQGEGSPDE